MPETYLFKTRPNYLFMVAYLVGIAFFGFIAHLMWFAKGNVHGVSQQTGHIIAMIFFAVCAFFVFVSLYLLLAFKLFFLTQTELITYQPLFFYKQHLLISDIQRITQGDVTIDIDANNPFTHSNVSIGNSSTLQLRNGKQVKFSSIEMWGYNMLLKKLYAAMRNHVKHS